ncbi:MAG: cobyrinate a,c-diamide synthase [Candidatus Adiutrix sp.]|jgi:cobyrinic acid a,c-diamide synthase|nr:cobyrinate a,c-diamide synthase [Candidatus Adiutrix sp.]
MRNPRLLLAGAHSGVGKTSVAAGLMAALVGRGLIVQPYKVGPDYIDPAFHGFVTGRKSRNLDSWLLEAETLRALFQSNAPGPAEGLSIIEGVMGLFDGHSREPVGSSAQVAQLLGAPVVLVINGAGLARSAAALVRGYDHFMPGLRLAGVIINQISSPAHYEMLENFIAGEAGVPCFGYLPKNPAFALESRHLGLVPSGEVADLKARLARLAEAAAATLDLDGLVRLAASAPELPPAAWPGPAVPPPGAPIRLGLALDQAFNFYYQDGLDLLSKMGAELIPFSPLADPALPPDLDGLYLGGGFPEVFAAGLAANHSLRSEIKAALENNLPAYAECGGLMYLGRTLVDPAGQAHPMTGFFPVRTALTPGLKNFGYVTVTCERDTVLGPAGTRFRAHEFHHSRIEDERPEDYVLKIDKAPGRAWRGGLARKNVLAAYPHLHFCAHPETAAGFLGLCRDRRQRKG